VPSLLAPEVAVALDVVEALDVEVALDVAEALDVALDIAVEVVEALGVAEALAVGLAILSSAPVGLSSIARTAPPLSSIPRSPIIRLWAPRSSAPMGSSSWATATGAKTSAARAIINSNKRALRIFPPSLQICGTLLYTDDRGGSDGVGENDDRRLNNPSPA
jgi:hypothetical protein